MPLRHTKTSQPSISVWFTPSINLHHGNGKVGIVSSTSTNQGGSRSHTFTTFIRTIRKKSWALLNCIQSYTAPAILRTDTISQCKGSLQTSTAKALADCSCTGAVWTTAWRWHAMESSLDWTVQLPVKKKTHGFITPKEYGLLIETPCLRCHKTLQCMCFVCFVPKTRMPNMPGSYAWFNSKSWLHYISLLLIAMHCIALHCILWIWGRRQGAWAL